LAGHDLARHRKPVAKWRREREIKKAVTALAEFDDRTLRDTGIPHRSQIEQIVRYGRDY